MQTQQTSQPSAFFAHWHLILAGILSIFSLSCLVLGTLITNSHIGFPAAHAESPLTQAPSAGPSTKEQLKVSVESLTLALGAITQSQKTDEDKLAQVKTTLNKLSFQPGQQAYYTLWDGNHLLHSPLTPDVNNSDLRLSTDLNGKKFVPQLFDSALEGGFTAILLPVPLADGSTITVKQWVYAKALPNSAWYVAAFLADDSQEEIQSLHQQGKQDTQAGLYYSGLSFAGLAGLLISRRNKSE